MYNEHCRLCGNQNNETLHIFGETGSNKQLESKIREIVRLNILPEDPLPKTVCVSCINHLENASHFIDQCHQTQTYLSQLYEETKLATPTLNSFRAPHNAEKITVVLNDRADIEINITKLRSILTCKLESNQSTNLDNDSIENNSSQIIPVPHDDNNTPRNSTRIPENLGVVQDNSNSNSSTSNCEPDGNTSNKTKATPVEKIGDENLDNIPSNDTCSSTNNSQDTVLLTNTQNTTNNRSRLKRKCTMRTKPINYQLDSDDGENREPDERSDYTDDLNDECNENRNNMKKPKLQTELRSFSCKLCTSAFEALQLLNQHVKTAHSGEQNKCSICGYVAKSRNFTLQLHMKNTHYKPYVCAVCDYRTGKKTVIREHIAKKHPPTSWTLKTNEENDDDKSSFCCTTCGKTFSEKLAYERHVKLQHSIRPFSCDLCTSSFIRMQHLNKHLKTVHTDTKVKCPICSHVVKYRGKLTQHMNVVHYKPFACAICDYRTGEKLRIRRHITKLHTPASWASETNAKGDDMNGEKTCDSSRFCCAFCGKTFSQELIFQEHLTFHARTRPFSCKLCKFSSRSKYTLNRHLQTDHSDMRSKCTIRERVVKHKDTPTQRIKIVNDTSFACDMCDYKTSVKDQIQKHVADKHAMAARTQKKNGENENLNDECNKNRNNRKNPKLQNELRSFSCKLCTSSFGALRLLNQHVKTVHPDEQNKNVIREHIAKKHPATLPTWKTNEKNDKKQFVCATCKRIFSNELVYQEHLNLHSGKRPFSCKLCTASFSARLSLNTHLRNVHSEKQFKCPTCDYVAKHKGKLTSHIRCVHDKPIECDQCGYKTGEKDKLQQHIASKHTSTSSFVCEICGKGFKTKVTLQLHIKNVHFPEPKVCQTCGTVCPSLSKYNAHIFTCGKEKRKFECDKCGQTYLCKQFLRDHMNKHLNRKPYKCKVCGKAFYLKIRLSTHEYVHRGAIYQCEICDQSFKRKDNMKNHMKRHSKK